MRALLLFSAAIVAACAQEQPPEPDPNAGAELEAKADPPLPPMPGGLPNPPPPPPPAPPTLPGLMPLSEAEIRAELGSGARCALGEGRPLLAAVPADAIVKDRGRIVHLRPDAKDWAALAKGGRFVGRDLTVRIDAGFVVARTGERVERSSGATIFRGKTGYGSAHGPPWICSSPRPELIRQSRLSESPVSDEEWAAVLAMAGR